MKFFMVLVGMLILFPACLCSKGVKSPAVESEHNLKIVDTSSPEYLKTLPVYGPFGKRGHSPASVVGTDKITDGQFREVFFKFINIPQSSHAQWYDFWSSRLKRRIGYSYKDGAEYEKTLSDKEICDEPIFEKVVEILDYRTVGDRAIVKAKIFSAAYPVEYEYDKPFIYEHYYIFLRESGEWKNDGHIKYHFTDDELREMGFDPSKIENRR